jgi:hypothetical protein
VPSLVNGELISVSDLRATRRCEDLKASTEVQGCLDPGSCRQLSTGRFGYHAGPGAAWGAALRGGCGSALAGDAVALLPGTLPVRS